MSKLPTGMRTRRWACKNFRVCKEDPNFCANCGDFASSHKGPTPGAIRTFRLPAPAKPITSKEALARALKLKRDLRKHQKKTKNLNVGQY